MLPLFLAVTGLASVLLALLWRRAGRRGEELEARVAALEERLEAAVADGRRSAEIAATLQRLLVEKGLAEVDDFDEARPGAAPEAPRGRGLH